jgi:hypothetical protein
MTNDERRRAKREPVDYAGTLFLEGGRSVTIRIKNLGQMGALVQVSDLEHPVREGDRVVLDHPLLGDSGRRRSTPGAIVRVELDFEGKAVHRELAVYFDGGAAPDGYHGPTGHPDPLDLEPPRV